MAKTGAERQEAYRAKMAGAGPRIGSLTLPMLADAIAQRHGYAGLFYVITVLKAELKRIEDSRKQDKEAERRRRAKDAEDWIDGKASETQLPRMILGLPRAGQLTVEIIQRAFRAKAMKLHPDRGGTGDSDTMMALQTARDMMLEEVKRPGTAR